MVTYFKYALNVAAAAKKRQILKCGRLSFKVSTQDQRHQFSVRLYVKYGRHIHCCYGVAWLPEKCFAWQYDVTAELNFDLLDRKCQRSSFILSDICVISQCGFRKCVMFGHSDLWTPNPNRFTLESKRNKIPSRCFTWPENIMYKNKKHHI